MDNKNSPEEAAKRASQENPIVMYLIVRESLGMSPGKIGAQCAHASQMLLLKHIEEAKTVNWTLAAHGDAPAKLSVEKVVVFQDWLNSSFRKVVLRADDKEWAKIKVEFPDCTIVVDAGLTEIAAGSETVIGLCPMYKSEVPKVIKKLQTLK